MNPLSNASAARHLAVFGAALAIAVSASLNIGFAVELGAAHSKPFAAVFAAGALAATLLAASMPACALAAFARFHIVRGMAALILWTAALAFSALAAIGAAAVARSDQADTRQAESSVAARVSAEHARLTEELSTINLARSPAEIAPLIAAIGARIGSDPVSACTQPKAPVSACRQFAELEAETARSVRRERIAAEIRELSARLDGVGAPRAADPQAAALAGYLAALGYRVPAESIGPWLALSVALFFELASALGLLAAGVGAPATRKTFASPATVEHSAPVAVPALTALPAPAPEADTKSDRDDEPPTGSARGVLKLIESHGGKIVGGQREIARQLGISKSRANELLHELAAAGAIKLSTSRTGSEIVAA